MAYEVIYAENPLHAYMDIHKVNRTILPNRSNSSKTIPARNGSHYTSHRYEDKVITLECKIVGEDKEDYVEKIRQIGYLLDVDEPQKLIISDSDDRYVLAVPDGEMAIERTGNIAQFTITFKCCTPYEYARTEKNTLKNSMVKVEGVWVANYEEEEGEVDEVEEGEGDDDEINYRSDEFESGYMEDFEEDYTPPEEDGWVDESTRSINTRQILKHIQNSEKITEYQDGLDIDYEIEPNKEDTEYDYASIKANEVPLVWNEEVTLAHKLAMEEEDIEPKGTDDTLPALINSHQHILHFYNTGSVPTYPVIHAEFMDNANFFTCSDDDGNTVLIGEVPVIQGETATASNSVVLNDTCTSLVDWTVAGNVLDTDRFITGNLGINKNGYAITCSNYGTSSEGWHGGAGRRNLSRRVKNFRVEIEMEHESSGKLSAVSNSKVTINDNNGSSGGSGSSGSATGWYKVTATNGAYHRKSNSKSSTLIQKIPKGKKVKITKISKKWGKCTYNKKTGWVYMSNVVKTSTPSTKGNSNSSNKNNSNKTSNKYKTRKKTTLRSARGTIHKRVKDVPAGVSLTVTSIKNGWGYTSYGGKKGYIYMSFLNKVSSSKKSRKDDYTTDVETKEDRKGVCEVYGFSNTGMKLFKCSMRDASAYFEYSQPNIHVGGTLVVEDGLPVPTALRKKVYDASSKKTTTYKIDSGSYGKWNSFDGKFIVERKAVSDTRDTWTCKVQKFVNGKVTEEIIKSVTGDKYPKEELASIVIFIGQYNDEVAVDTQNVCSIKVTDLTPISNETQIVESPTFKAGDNLVIDFDSQEVLLNGMDYLRELDVSSNFFKIKPGMADVLCQSDTEKMKVMADYRERWL